ncbi:DNA-binding protein [Candidatus Woesearchaeota archaeon]|nr:DNA-binding protein [Candidatus Woesearchaeota archaeon]
MVLVLLDTNFLLAPGQFKVDVFAGLERACEFSHELAVPEAVIAELSALAAGEKVSLKDRRAARLGLQLLKARDVRVLKTRKVFKSADKALLELASADKDVVVATQDRELKRRLKSIGVRVALVRQKRYVMID